MSGICGIVNFDGAPVDPELLRRMAEAAAYRGPDGITYWIEGNVGLAHLALHTTPESLRERQPLVNRRGDVILTADARVDNRDELMRTLTTRGYLEEKDPTDADLILAAYECWGEACAREIIGDFAFAVWDKRERKLVCSRDPVGIRPLFFTQRGQTLFVASTIASLLAGLGERPALNEPLVVDFLCWNFERWVYQTIYQGIFRVPASHTLLARDNHITFDRHWILGAQPGPRYKTDEEYVAHFRELFEEAVRCRLRSIGPVGISVSGGLDSSSIACMAHDRVERGHNADVRVYSCVFDERFPAADERQYLQAVLEKCHRFPFTAIPGETLWGFKETSTNGGFALDEPEIFPIRAMLTEVLRAARADGCRTVLMGEGADQVLRAGAYWLPELLPDVEMMSLKKELKYFWQRNGCFLLSKLIRLVLATFLRWLLPEFVLHRYESLRRSRFAPVWMNSQHIEPVASKELGPLAHFTIPSLSRSGSITYRKLTGGWYAALIAYETFIASRLESSYSYPFLDRRLVDFLLLLPPNLLFANGHNKLILRQSMTDILAKSVLQRFVNAHFTEVVDIGYREQERNSILVLLKQDVQTCQGRWIKIGTLQEAWENYYRGTALPSRVLAAPIFLQDWLENRISIA